MRLVTRSIDPPSVCMFPLVPPSLHQPGRPHPHLCSTAISFSMLFSLPSNAFFGMHLMATSLWVRFSSARTTSEKAPLWSTAATRLHVSGEEEWGARQKTSSSPPVLDGGTEETRVFLSRTPNTPSVRTLSFVCRPRRNPDRLWEVNKRGGKKKGWEKNIPPSGHLSAF